MRNKELTERDWLPSLNTQAEQQLRQVNQGRDYSVYTWRMDAALENKVNRLIGEMRNIKDDMLIVDAGSGTGLVAQTIVERLRQIVNVRVVALDLSHEFYDASSDQPLIELAFGDAAEKNFLPDSVDIMYFSTSGHEVASFGGGPQRMTLAMENTFEQLKPGGQVIIRDFVLPENIGPILMELPQDDGIDVDENTLIEQINYSDLSTMAKFKRFHREFAGGGAFEYQIVRAEQKELVKLDAQWAYEFYMRKEYTGNWRNEINEKYGYWTMTQAMDILEDVGFIDVDVKPDPNEYMLTHWLEGKVQLYHQNEDGELQTLDFPATHMVISGVKPGDQEGEHQIDEKIDQFLDFQKVLDSIVIDLDKGVIVFKPWKVDQNGQIVGQEIEFEIDPQPLLVGRKHTLYQLKNDPNKIIKIPNADIINQYGYVEMTSQFKAMMQTVSRQEILEKNGTNHLQIHQVDPFGPPYRFVVQDALPDNAICVADLIIAGRLSEMDIDQICQQVNIYESGVRYQLDTNPFAWYRVEDENGITSLIYASGKVYLYDERWQFAKIGLLQWTNSKYLENADYYFPMIPKKKEQLDFAAQWQSSDNYSVWKQYLDPDHQPKV